MSARVEVPAMVQKCPRVQQRNRRITRHRRTEKEEDSDDGEPSGLGADLRFHSAPSKRALQQS